MVLLPLFPVLGVWSWLQCWGFLFLFFPPLCSSIFFPVVLNEERSLLEKTRCTQHLFVRALRLFFFFLLHGCLEHFEFKIPELLRKPLV